MIKGCTKRVIVVKDVQSDVFEEAYFILRPVSEKDRYSRSETDILREANRIVTDKPDCGTNPYVSLAVGTDKPSKTRVLAAFFIGCAFAAAVYTAVLMMM